MGVGAWDAMRVASAVAAVALLFLTVATAVPDQADFRPLVGTAPGRPLDIHPPEAWLTDDPPSGPATPGIQGGLGPGSALLLGEEVGEVSSLCTASFIFRDPATAKYYLGTAGHCLVRDSDDPTPYTGAANPTKVMHEVDVCVAGCISNALGIGTYVELQQSASYQPVTFAQSGGVGLDFGIVEIPAALHSQIRPWMPQWGGPTGIDSGSTGEPMAHYGHGNICCIVIGVVTHTPADQGRPAVSLGSDTDSFSGAGWASGGDSGSGVVMAAPSSGRGLQGTGAAGTLTHAIGAYGPFSGTTIEQGLAMVRQATGLNLELVLQDDPLPTKPAIQYTLAIQEPGPKSRPAVGSKVALKGTAAATGGELPADAFVEVSVDDPGFAKGAKADGVSSWTASWTPAQAGSHTVRARLVSGGATLAQANVTLTAQAPPSSSTQGPSTSSAPSGEPEPGEGLEGGEGEGETAGPEAPSDGPKAASPRKATPAAAVGLLACALAVAAVLVRRRAHG